MAWSIVEKIFDFPPETVFELLIDYERLGLAHPTIDTITYIGDQKRGVGTRTRWTVSVSVETEGKEVLEWEEEVTAFEQHELVGFKVVSGGFPSVGFLRVYPYAMGAKTFLVFGEHHEYPGVNIPKIKATMIDQLAFMEKMLKGELSDRNHKR